MVHDCSGCSRTTKLLLDYVSLMSAAIWLLCYHQEKWLVSVSVMPQFVCYDRKSLSLARMEPVYFVVNAVSVGCVQGFQLTSVLHKRGFLLLSFFLHFCSSSCIPPC